MDDWLEAEREIDANWPKATNDAARDHIATASDDAARMDAAEQAPGGSTAEDRDRPSQPPRRGRGSRRNRTTL